MARIAVLGPGGVGGLLAARLGAAGHDVTLIATERTAATISVDGLHLKAPGTPVVVTRPEARPYLINRPDVLFVAVKATDLLPALERVAAAVLGAATVVPFLNGIDHLRLLRGVYPDATVVAASISVEATRHRPGEIEQVSTMADVAVADGTAAGRTVADLVRDSGLSVSTDPDEQAVLWRKLTFLAPFALLTTGADAPIGVARARHDRLLRSLVDEAVAAAAGCGVVVDPDGVRSRLHGVPAEMTSSMFKDQRAGRALELDAIAGPIIRALGVDAATATAGAVRDILARAESGARG